MKIKSRRDSLILTIVIYILSLIAALITYHYLGNLQAIWAAFAADAAATLVVWLFGVVLKNSSVYDPYWSVAPVIIAAFWGTDNRLLQIEDIILLALMALWGIRLTANWAGRWQGLGHQDWRYTMYQQKMPRLWFAVNLFGINLMPTVLVYLGLVPVYFALRSASMANFLTLTGYLACALAIILELVADRQMDAYRRYAGLKSGNIGQGLWLWCRHPNYLGEMLFWWGLWLVQISLLPSLWITVAGPLFISLLFLFVSIPMMEKHMIETHPSYAQTMERVPMLLPLFAKAGRKRVAET